LLRIIVHSAIDYDIGLVRGNLSVYIFGYSVLVSSAWGILLQDSWQVLFCGTIISTVWSGTGTAGYLSGCKFVTEYLWTY